MRTGLAGKSARADLPRPLTVSRIAKADDVGVATVRYHQLRGLVQVPAASSGCRIYPASTVHRIAFIKRAQSLGFTLEEVRTLLDLEDGRNRGAIQSVAQARLGEIETKLADLQRMHGALSDHRDACRWRRVNACLDFVIFGLTAVQLSSLAVRRVSPDHIRGRNSGGGSHCPHSYQ